MFYEPFSNNVSAYLLKHIFKLLLVFLRDLLLCMIHAGILETTFAIFEPHRGLVAHTLIFFSMQQYEWLVGPQYKPMELVKSDWAAIRKSPPWALDSWGLGKCIIALSCILILLNFILFQIGYKMDW